MRMTWAAALAAVALTGVATPAAADVTLIRGAFAETVPAGGRTALPAVLRGARPLPAAAIRPAAAPTPAGVEPETAPQLAVAGRVLWLIDRTSHRVQACWLRGTGMAGEDAIVCTPR